MMKDLRVRMLALAAGCVCCAHGSALGGGSMSQVSDALGSASAGSAISVPSERAFDAPMVNPLDGPIGAVAFQPAQVGDANLQPIVMPAPDLRAVADEDARAGDIGPAPYRIGVTVVPVAGPISADRDGIWDVLPDGTMVWTVRIEAPTALALSLEFSNLDLPDGAVLLIRGADGFAQAWEGTGPNGNGFLQSPLVEGTYAEVQYLAPAGVNAAPGITINSVSHIYRMGILGPADDRPADERVDLPCHEDVACHTVDANARDAVGAMLFNVPGGQAVCTGALLADTDPNTQRGWFLTANHCISSQTTVNSLNVYWLYQKPTCGGITPSLGSRPRSTGGTLISTSAQTDYCLLRFANDPNSGQGFAAWTTNSPSLGATVRGIHHPNFEYKRFSEGNTTTQQPTGCFSTSFFYYGDWTVGMTEGGSSGSPLFNTNWEVIGQLYGACFFSVPACDNPSQWNWLYGRFNQTYLQNPAVQSALTTIDPDDAYEDNDTNSTPAALDFGSHNLTLIDFDDYFEITVDCPTTLTVAATFTTSQMDLDLFLYNQFNSLITSQTGTGSPKTIVQAVNPGTYKIRASKTSGWGGNYTLNVSINPGCVVNGVCCFSCNHALNPGTCADGTNYVQSFCAELSGNDCVALGGAYRGDNTTCATLAQACVCSGDITGDGDCNSADFNVLASGFGLGAPTCLTRAQGDLNCDGVVNSADFNILASSFGCTGN